jgi:hypothetical protein
MAAVIAPERSLRPVRPVRPGARPHLRVVPPSPGPRRAHASVYRRRRMVAVLAVLVLLAVTYLALTGAQALLSGRTAAGAAGISPAPAAAPVSGAIEGAAVEGSSYVVQPGDTLWSIAVAMQPDGDIRELVDRLADRNGGAGVQVGQRLSLDDLAG